MGKFGLNIKGMHEFYTRYNCGRGVLMTHLRPPFHHGLLSISATNSAKVNHNAEVCMVAITQIILLNHHIVHINVHQSLQHTCTGWLLQSFNLITASGSVSNEPSSVTWLATRQLKKHALRWINHFGKLITVWPQNISIWPKKNLSIHWTLELKTSHKYSFHPFYL